MDLVTVPSKLAAALVDAQNKAKAVPRDAQNSFHKYRYASAESMIEEGRSALGAAGLSLVQASTIIVPLEHDLEQGKERARVLVNIGYVLTHTSGEAIGFSRSWPCVESGGRPIDKAVGGALTTALAYTIRDVLMLPRDDDKAAMDRRDDPDVEKQEEPTRNDAVPSSPAEKPASSGDVLSNLIDVIRSRVLARSVLDDQIARADLSDKKRAAASLIADAYYATKLDQITASASRIKELALPDDAHKWLMGEIKRPFEALQAQAAS